MQGIADVRTVLELSALFFRLVATRKPHGSDHRSSQRTGTPHTDPNTGAERVIEIPPTLLITGLGIVPRLDRCTTTDAKCYQGPTIRISEMTVGGTKG